MTFSCRYFADGSQYGQYDFAKFMDDALEDGYVAGLGNELKCSSDGTDMRIAVATGRGYMHGYSFDVSDSPEYVTLPTADATYDRIDRVVARLSPDTNKNITLTYVQGTPASTPVAPAITRTDATWEISLARVKVPHGSSYIPSANVYDDRDDFTVCGISNGIDGSKVTHGTVPYQRLPVSSKSAMGIVKVGYGIDVTADGTISTSSIGLTGHFSESSTTEKPYFSCKGPTVTFSLVSNSTTCAETHTQGAGSYYVCSWDMDYNYRFKFATSCYSRTLDVSPVSLTIKAYSTGIAVQVPYTSGYSWNNYKLDGTLKLRHKGVVVSTATIVEEAATGTKDFGYNGVANFSISTTYSDLIDGEWDIVGTSSGSGNTGTVSSWSDDYQGFNRNVENSYGTHEFKYFVMD